MTRRLETAAVLMDRTMLGAADLAEAQTARALGPRSAR